MTLHLDLTGVKGSKMDAYAWLWAEWYDRIDLSLGQRVHSWRLTPSGGGAAGFSSAEPPLAGVLSLARPRPWHAEQLADPRAQRRITAGAR